MLSEVLQDRPLLAFYGDDFTGSTDALEALATAGVECVLFTNPPSAEELRQYPLVRAIGVAGMTRSFAPEAMEQELRRAFSALATCRPAVVHYKVCSTFDSSPLVGSIGKAIDVGMDVLRVRRVPVLVAAPSLGRYCVFGNLFAACGSGGSVYRLDRHPSMRHHPMTPMDEADLRLHLGKQTTKRVALLDVLQLEQGAERRWVAFERLADQAEAVLIDGLSDAHLKAAGELLWKDAGAAAREGGCSFVVGSSGVESALCAQWAASGLVGGEARFAPVQDRGPILAVCGSCSPVTAQQICHAREKGFAHRTLGSAGGDRSIVEWAAGAIAQGRSVIVSTAGTDDSDAETVEAKRREYGMELSRRLGEIALQVLQRAPARRMLIAGGDTSSHVARVLGIRSVRMIGRLTRGSPLCVACAPGSPADGMEITFKGGQIGSPDFFLQVEGVSLERGT